MRLTLATAKNSTAAPPRSIVVEGAWAHEMLLASGTKADTFLWCPGAARTTQARVCADRMCATASTAYEISEKVLARLSDREKPDGLVSLAQLPHWDAGTWEFGESALVLVADGIEYAGNLGTLIRTADACRAECLALVNRRVRLTHRRVFGASRGTVLSMPVLEFADGWEVAEWLDRHGFEVILANPRAGRTYRDCDYREARTAVVVGSEGRGPSRMWWGRPVTEVSIPMLGSADSLNVAASAAILLFGARARRAGW
ncbi:TrmH family RNA methyltransferase [Actinopolymorpha sp. B11F2]|uniref:TrmH family RNA methyltransferase n=1 Tax=Actinopolymorpha sp. B11F2 TaxID=3160862 RepID=UPI0032E4BD06